MSVKSFLQTFDRALGSLVALIFGAVGAGLLYVAWNLWDGVFWMAVIGGVLVLIALAMLYWRVTFLRIFEFFAYANPWS